MTVKAKCNEHPCRLNLLHEGHCNNYVQASADILRENNTKTGLPGFHCYMPLSWQRLLGRRTLNICVATADQLRMYCPIIGTNFIIFEYSIIFKEMAVLFCIFFINTHTYPNIHLCYYPAQATINVYLFPVCNVTAPYSKEVNSFEPQHDKTNKWRASQGRLGSAWASAQSDQSLHCPPEESLSP